jgi:hypothetical protein
MLGTRASSVRRVSRAVPPPAAPVRGAPRANATLAFEGAEPRGSPLRETFAPDALATGGAGVAATGGAGRSEGTGPAATGLAAGGALRSCAGTGGEPPCPGTAPDPGAGKLPVGTDALRVPDVGSGTRSLGGSGTGRGTPGGDAMGGGEGEARSRPSTATGGPTGAGGPTSRSVSRSGGFGTAGRSGGGGSATMLGARGLSAACCGVRTSGAAGASAGGAEATAGGGTGTPPGASAAEGGGPSGPADGELEATGLSEGPSGTAPTQVLSPVALSVTGRMVERSVRLSTDESRDRRRASPPSPATTHNTTTMATPKQLRVALRRPRLRGA